MNERGRGTHVGVDVLLQPTVEGADGGLRVQLRGELRLDAEEREEEGEAALLQQLHHPSLGGISRCEERGEAVRGAGQGGRGKRKARQRSSSSSIIRVGGISRCEERGEAVRGAGRGGEGGEGRGRRGSGPPAAPSSESRWHQPLRGGEAVRGAGRGGRGGRGKRKARQRSSSAPPAGERERGEGAGRWGGARGGEGRGRRGSARGEAGQGGGLGGKRFRIRRERWMDGVG